MEDQLKQIGERLRGLRDVLDLTAEEVAETIGISVEKYEKIEAGELDITISNLMKMPTSTVFRQRNSSSPSRPT